MQKKRIVWFLIMIGAGLALGLLYGWIINPVKYVDTQATTLRADYRTDYILMVAEIYQSDGDLEGSVARLGLVSSSEPGQAIAEALQTARSLGYPPADLSLMENLSQALLKETGAPRGEAQP
jgi:hypothetical protein